MPRLTADQWQSIRAEREAGATFDSLAAKNGVSKTAIVKKSNGEGWGDGSDLAEVIRRKVTEKVTGIVTSANPKKKAEAIDDAAEKAAAVIEQHRNEWKDHRVRFGSTTADFEDGKLAKINAEMLKIRQSGERLAYGLDAAVETKNEDIAAIAAEARRRLGV